MAEYQVNEQMLNTLENVHRERCGDDRLFCYVETPYYGGFYRLSFVEEDEPGHFPIEGEVGFFGTQAEMSALAVKLNRTRLGLTPLSTVAIVASSMSFKRR